jgi:hypothetical protein
MADAVPLPLGNMHLRGYRIGDDNWIFYSSNSGYIPSTWMVIQMALKREGFSGTISHPFVDSWELEGLLSNLKSTHGMDAINEIHDLHYGSNNFHDHYFDFRVVAEIRMLILSGRLQVFKVSHEVAARMANYDDIMYREPSSYKGTPVQLTRYKLAEKLGTDIVQRWAKKDESDRTHFDRWDITRSLIEGYDTVAEVVDFGWDLIKSLVDIGVFIVKIVGNELIFHIEVTAKEIEAAANALSGDMQEAREALEARGVIIDERIQKQKEFVKKIVSLIEKGKYLLNQLKQDPDTVQLFKDYFDSLYQSLPYREERNVLFRVGLEIGIEVLIAIGTGGSGTLARQSARVSANTTRIAHGASVAKRIGPFTAETIDTMSDLARAIERSNVKGDTPNTPVRVHPADDAPRSRSQTPERARQRAAHEEKLNDHHQAVDDHQATYERRRDEAIANDESNRTVGAHKAKITEAKGERAAADYMSENHPDADIVRGFEPGTGFDQVWVKRDADGNITEYMIVEAKGPGAKLSTNAQKGPQMSQQWVNNTANEMRRSSNAAASDLGRDIRNAIRRGPPPRVTGIGLEAVEQNGRIVGAREITLPNGTNFN